MEWLFERLEQEEAAERRRLESLRAQVAASEERLARFAITRETALALRADDPADETAGEEQVREPSPVAEAGQQGGPPGRPGAAGSGSDSGSAWAQRDRCGLTGVNEQVVVLLAGAGRAMRAREVTLAMGEPDQHGRVEGMRTRLKRLVAGGWLAEQDRGLFSVASGVNGFAEEGAAEPTAEPNS